MLPEILGYRPLPLLLAIAIVVGWVPALRAAHRDGFSGVRVVLYLLALGLIAVVGAKVYSVLERGPFVPLSDEFRTGFRYPGGLFALVVGAPVLCFMLPVGLPVRRPLDYMAPGIAFSLAITRVDCLLAGCCAGAVCSYPWCIRFPRFSPVWNRHFDERWIEGGFAQSLAVHPLQIYFLIASLAAGWILLRVERHKTFEGQIILLFLALHEGAKYLLEFFRDPPEATIQSFSLGLACAGVIGLLVGMRVSRSRPSPAAA